jgi:lipopolysaccharide heptosyltransferase I
MQAVAEPQRILLIRPSALGDVCRTVPVLASLRQRWPEAQIDWLVNDAFAPVIESHPALTNIVPFERKRFSKWHHPAVMRALLGWLREIRRTEYDLVIDCQGLFRSGLFAWASRAPIRVGYANAAEFGWLGYNRRQRVDRSMHTVDRMLALLGAIDVPIVHDMRLYSNATDRASVDQKLRSASASERLVVIAPTSRWDAKRWPADRFAALAETLLRDNKADRIAIVGAPGEEPQCEPITTLAQRDDRIIDLVGQCSVGELLAVIERSSLVIANDSASLHIAVGFDRPIAALFGPTDVALVGPYRREDTVIQRLESGDSLDHKNERLGSAIMARITLDEALSAVDRALSSKPTPEHAA